MGHSDISKELVIGFQFQQRNALDPMLEKYFQRYLKMNPGNFSKLKKCPKKFMFSIKPREEVDWESNKLGNQIFEYAAMLTVCKTHKCTPVLEDRMLLGLKEYFPKIREISLHQALTSCPNRSWRKLNSFRDFLKEKNNFRNDYIMFESPYSAGMFSKYKREIRNKFKLKFKPAVSNTTRKILKRILKNQTNKNLIGVHVRQEDYGASLKMKPDFETLGSSYFRNAMDYFQKKYKDPIFLVFTEFPIWCEEFLDKGNFDIRYPGKEYGNRKTIINDLALLSHCNGSIISYGTFGFLGAFLSNGEVAYPKIDNTTAKTPELQIHRTYRSQNWTAISIK